MVSDILKKVDKTWFLVGLFFALGLLAPYGFRFFFQTLPANANGTVKETYVSYPQSFEQAFYQAVQLTDSEQYDQAIEVYQAIIRDYPNYPEPYNNLAVIYAQNNQLALAEKTLEKALQTNKSYFTIYANLAGIYEKLASDAYRQALHIDKPSSVETLQLTHLKALGTPSVLIAQETSASSEEASPITLSTSLAQLSEQDASNKETTPVIVPNPLETQIAEMPQPEPLPDVTAQESSMALQKLEVNLPELPPTPRVTPSVEGMPTIATKETPIETQTADKESVEEAARAWARAWSQQNTQAYFNSYAKEFKVPGGLSRSAWEKTRQQRITEKKKIHVALSHIKVDFMDDNRAKVRFTQRYEAGALKTSTRKTLIMKKAGSQWKIVEERIG